MFYTDNTDVVRLVKAIRGYRPTVLKYRNLTTDMMSRFRDFKDSWVNRKDVPSKEIGVIWLDKIFMIEETMRANPFGTDWFCWNDAGNAYYRHAPIPINHVAFAKSIKYFTHKQVYIQQFMVSQ